MRAMLFLPIVVILSSCGSGLVKYDEIKNESTIQVRLSEIPFSDRSKVKTEIGLIAKGRGKAPASWECFLAVDADDRDKGPTVLGEKPTLEFWPNEHRTAYNAVYKSEYSTTESVLFQLTIDELVALFEQKRFKLNEKAITLSGEQLKILENAILAIRRSSNS